MKVKRYLIIFFFVVCLLPACANAVPQPPHNVYGYVKDQNNTRVGSGVAVKFNDSSGIVASTTTRENGYYDINIQNASEDETLGIYVKNWFSGESITWTSGASEEVNITGYNYSLPTVETGSASDISTDSAKLHASIHLRDVDSVDVHFLYRKSGSTEWKKTDWVSNYSQSDYSKTVSGLNSSTKYKFEAEIRFDNGTDSGGVKSFTTKSVEEPTEGGGGTGGGGAPSGGLAPTKEKPQVKRITASVREDSAVADVGSVRENQTVVISFEPPKVIESVKFTSQVSADGVSLNFRYLDLDKPQGVPSPGKYVYSYQALSLEGLENTEIRNLKITFRVSKPWVGRVNKDPSKISMKKYSQREWHSLGTKLLGESNGYHRYRSLAPGFSYFAVTFRKTVEPHPSINIRNVEISPKRGRVPVNLTLDITVENYGLKAGQKEIEIILDNETLTSRTVFVDPGETNLIPVYLTIEEPGKHEIKVGDFEKSFTVERAGARWNTALQILALALILGVIAFVSVRYDALKKIDKLARGAKERGYHFKREGEAGSETSTEGKTITNIKHLKGNKEKYISQDVVLKDVQVEPVKEAEKGWWHEIKDGTGKISGLSSKKIQGSGKLEGVIKKVNGKIYISF